MTDIQKRMLATFLVLRIGVGVIGILFPILLWAGGRYHHIELAGSMSAYYHAHAGCLDPKRTATCSVGDQVTGAGPMRNWFVGILFVIGAIMGLMRGFSRWEDGALDVAGVMAVGVALIPMPWTAIGKGFSPHGFCAITFFLCIAFVCAFCSDKTLKHMPLECPNRNKVIAFYRRSYRILAVAMILSPIVAYVLNILSLKDSFQFFAETLGIWAFGAYWLFKTAELSNSGVEKKALTGELPLDTSKRK